MPDSRMLLFSVRVIGAAVCWSLGIWCRVECILLSEGSHLPRRL